MISGLWLVAAAFGYEGPPCVLNIPERELVLHVFAREQFWEADAKAPLSKHLSALQTAKGALMTLERYSPGAVLIARVAPSGPRRFSWDVHSALSDPETALREYAKADPRKAVCHILRDQATLDGANSLISGEELATFVASATQRIDRQACSAVGPSGCAGCELQLFTPGRVEDWAFAYLRCPHSDQEPYFSLELGHAFEVLDMQYVLDPPSMQPKGRPQRLYRKLAASRPSTRVRLTQ